LNNLDLEIKAGLFEKNELALILNEKLYGKYLNFRKRKFFLYHFIPLWEYSIQKIFDYKKEPKVLDLGCATGTSSFLFSSLGAKVAGIELEEELVNICNKRKIIYNKTNRDLKVNYFQSDVFTFPYENQGPFDVVFSLFAFNLMQPSKTLIEKIIPNLGSGGMVLIIDGNQDSIYSMLLPSRKRVSVLKPSEIKILLKSYDFNIIDLKYFCFIPPFLFRFKIFTILGELAEKVLSYFKLMKIFGTTYAITAIKEKT
jgi:SAM-dependent methyltransferase